MSTDTKYIALRLQGPLQSWGVDSQYSRRNTDLMPTKSAVAGMCCAALGFARGSETEATFLLKFAEVRMTAIAIPRVVGRKGRVGADTELAVRRLQDYHTVQNTRKADGGLKDCHITYRQYLADASFGVILEGASVVLEEVASALADPKWGLWLGRKSCIPSAPILAGLRNTREEALQLLLGKEPLESFTRHEEAASFSEGTDAIPDQPISFASERRLFAPRRIYRNRGAL
ncbi:MAG: type I-E CRISPR-associated protein Cas5/CasD [Pirellulales bacterium]